MYLSDNSYIHVYIKANLSLVFDIIWYVLVSNIKKAYFKEFDFGNYLK